MSNMLDRIEEALAARSSRRGFIATVGRITAVGAAILAGTLTAAETALASTSCCPTPLCSG